MLPFKFIIPFNLLRFKNPGGISILLRLIIHFIECGVSLFFFFSYVYKTSSIWSEFSSPKQLHKALNWICIRFCSVDYTMQSALHVVFVVCHRRCKSLLQFRFFDTWGGEGVFGRVLANFKWDVTKFNTRNIQYW